MAFISILSFHAPSFAASHELKSCAITVTINDQSGDYSLARSFPPQTWSGTTGLPLKQFVPGEGFDNLGAFKSVKFKIRDEDAYIHVYNDRALIVFGWSIAHAMPKPPADFPNFTKLPQNQHILSYQDSTFAPPRFDGENSAGSPYIFFDDHGDTTIISPAANFMTASLHGDGGTSISSGFDEKLENLPAGFKHRTLIAFDHGINTTFHTWGDALVALLDVKRPTNDADIGLKTLGYWTDNRSTYYYHYDPDKGYAGTLLAVADELKHLGVKLGYMQIDSWWYQKTSTGPDGKEGSAKKNKELPEGSWNKYGGLLEWTAHPDLFPHGLSDWQQKLGLPLIAHNRWVDLHSPYRDKFAISGVGAVDPKWWARIADYCKQNNIVTYEQDWLDRIYNFSPEFSSTTDQAEAFMDNMARATKARGVTMQYCMLLPRHYLQGAKYDNLTTVRVSDDGFDRSRWTRALYVSTLAGALKEWPWVDVYMSSQTPEILISTLTGGMVGVGDPLGKFDTENLSLAARSDGVIVKPDRPLTPIDAKIIADGAKKSEPMIAATYSQHGDLKTAYVFAYPEKEDQTSFHFTAADVGLSGDVYVYDWKAKSGKKVAAGETYNGSFDGSISTSKQNPTWVYFVVAPISKSGVALIGDTGKFATMGSQRILKIDDDGSSLQATVRFAPDENQITLLGVDRNGKTFTQNVSRPSGSDTAVVKINH